MLVPAIVMAPLSSVAVTGDHRFHIYDDGPRYAANPLNIVSDVWTTADDFFRLGNFRPLGRTMEKFLDLLMYLISRLFGLPLNTSLRIVGVLATAALALALVYVVEAIVGRGRLFSSAPTRLAAVIPFTVGAGFVAAGNRAPTLLFAGLYHLSAALVVVVAAVIARGGYDHADRLARRWAFAAVAMGAALAVFNEMAYLAPPLAAVAVLARGRLVLGRSWRDVLRGTAARRLAWLWAGFLPVFLTVRQLLAQQCAAHHCYQNSDVALGGDVFLTLPSRFVSSMAPALWSEVGGSGGSPSAWLVLSAAVAVGLLAWRAWQDLPHLTEVSRRQGAALAVVALALLALGAALGSIALGAQRQALGGDLVWGWRDTALTTPAFGLLVVGLTVALLSATRHPLRWAGVLVPAAIAVVVSASTNAMAADTLAAKPINQLNNRIALSVSDFDSSPAGNRTRCDQLDEFNRRTPNVADERRLVRALNSTTIARHGVHFCERPAS